MGRVHADLDVYVGEEHRYEGTRITEDARRGTVTIRARESRRQGYQLVMSLTEAKGKKLDSVTFQWTGLNEDGEQVTITGVHRKPPCCGGR